MLNTGSTGAILSFKTNTGDYLLLKTEEKVDNYDYIEGGDTRELITPYLPYLFNGNQ